MPSKQVKVSAKVYDQLKQHARMRSVPMSSLVALAVTEYLGSFKPEQKTISLDDDWDEDGDGVWDDDT